MSKNEREFVTRSENVRREQRTIKERKLDRLLNVLIAIVVILIFINVYIIFLDQDKKEIAQQQTNEQPVKKPIEHQLNNTTEDTNKTGIGMNEGSQVAISPSNDPLVEEVIVDASWQPTPTTQQGEHLSSYDVGHIDYEEKIATFLQAVQLTKQETIFWSVRNNGSPTTSIAVLSTNDKQQMYRVSIEWIDKEGWKPVKVERLKQLDGAYQKDRQ